MSELQISKFGCSLEAGHQNKIQFKRIMTEHFKTFEICFDEPWQENKNSTNQ